MPSPEFSVSVHDLDASGKAFRLPIRAAWIRGALEDTEIGPGLQDGELDLRLSKSGADVIVRGTLRAHLTVPCARCLGPAQVPIKEELSALALPIGKARGEKRGEDRDIGRETADTIAYDGDSLVLDDLVRDELLLGLPMIPLCSEACPGIRPQASRGAPGVDIDARLGALTSPKKT